MFTEYKKFNYEQPRMEYNKETGDVTIFEPEGEKKRKIISSIDEVFDQK